ncbi:MAG: oligopeptide/dipeptide ABC transporter ATP-binding protein [Aminobacterium sp.]|nr:ATP-binding cassette domain-containing protein [Aminobacterium sp.]MDD3425427.1 ATP-binding cassette domain-containing protein [Aminobacterium sp.]MDD3707928.1 ATP-binding cassette domain-containing protein [Aminobacterium sp.]MDD4229454.1 ATP-binding cassette domain-containing protein [Aminobacterium sp.]MDD4550998.1 ATP-binding cassette domain-containing protein [Aminobacterium sp.]
MCAQVEKTETFIEIKHLKKYFNVHKGLLHAVDDVNLSIPRGKTLGLVGESGCGKSTLGRVVIGLIEATGGEVLFDGEDTLKYNKEERNEFRKRAQIVFQDPFSSLNPRMSVSQLIAEPLLINKTCSGKKEIDAKIKKLMDTVGLAERLATSFPHELDGGRRQRIGVARALALDPDFIVLDEPVSALDVCIQAQILNLLGDLQKEREYTYLFISHDLSVVRYVSDEVAVMYLGQVVEKAENIALFKEPLHPYTQALLSAVPVVDLDNKKKRILLEGDVPSPIDPPAGCRFAGRCAYRQDICTKETPLLNEIEPGHFVSCHFTKHLERHK